MKKVISPHALAILAGSSISAQTTQLTATSIDGTRGETAATSPDIAVMAVSMCSNFRRGSSTI